MNLTGGNQTPATKPQAMHARIPDGIRKTLPCIRQTSTSTSSAPALSLTSRQTCVGEVCPPAPSTSAASSFSGNTDIATLFFRASTYNVAKEMNKRVSRVGRSSSRRELQRKDLPPTRNATVALRVPLFSKTLADRWRN